MSYIVFALVTLLVWRELFHAKIQSDLLNKLMSRNYHEYQVAQSVGQPKPEFQAPMIDENDIEDLSPLSGFQTL